jgi:catechol 2,3-dioxygenase-like lactoylglutathione lyase family enzyme
VEPEIAALTLGVVDTGAAGLLGFGITEVTFVYTYISFFRKVSAGPRSTDMPGAMDPVGNAVPDWIQLDPAGGCALTRSTFDVCAHTNDIVDMLAFWKYEAGLDYEGALLIREGLTQHRMRVGDSIIKINHYTDALPPTERSGYRKLLIAREDGVRTRTMKDPDGNEVTEVTVGDFGIRGIGVVLHARDVMATRMFYETGLGLPAEGTSEVRVLVGSSRVVIRPDPSAHLELPVHGRGWRFLTLPVVDVDMAFARAVKAGIAGLPPQQLGALARYAFVRDPDGNWIELSQRLTAAAQAQLGHT